MQKWEYAFVILEDPAEFKKEINVMGRKGWEMVSAERTGYVHIAYFKRPLE